MPRAPIVFFPSLQVATTSMLSPCHPLSDSPFPIAGSPSSPRSPTFKPRDADDQRRVGSS
eukprot:3943031-Prorocentrum_lima.AAC.1